VFQDLISIAATFDASPTPQKFPSDLVKVNLNNYLVGGKDFTRSGGNYYPLIVEMKGTNGNESIFYFQYTLNRGGPPSVQLLKQKVIYNGQLFELTEAYGLKSKGDDANTEECVICLTLPKDTICKPCKQVSLCKSCAQVVF